MANVSEIVSQLMEHLCNHDWHGYTQASGTPGRWGDGEGDCIVNVGGKEYRLQQGDRDCSSAIISIFKSIGIKINATYTGNMKQGFLETGLFKWYPANSGYNPVRGDVCLNEANHTAMYLGNGLLGEFSIAENGSIYGQTGDQNGREAYIHAFYNYPWDGYLHYIGKKESSNSDTDTDEPKYRVYTREDGWLEWMNGLSCTDGCGDDFAGVRGHLHRNAQFKDLGSNGWFQLVMKRQGALPRNTENKDLSDYVIGYIIYFDTPNPNTTGYYKAKYRIATIGNEYLKWEYDDEDGGAGDDKNGVDRLQLTLEKA